jgi:tRNA(Arg) A34 adenosine deaminase TadA
MNKDINYEITFHGSFPFNIGNSKLKFIEEAIEQAIIGMELKTPIKIQRKINQKNKEMPIHYDGTNGLPLVHSNHGAILVNKSGNIMARGYNHVGQFTFKNKNLQRIVHPYEYTVHAEMDVIRKYVSKNYKKTEDEILKDLRESKMYVVRISRLSQNKLLCKMSTPCETCAKNLEEFNIKRIFSS